MPIRILDLDGSITGQGRLLDCLDPQILDLGKWGPKIRMGCRFGRFHRFEQRVAELAASSEDTAPLLTFYGSGDFHHVSLALLKRLRQPFNLLVLDNHPDWMRLIPFMHCGTWLLHAAGLPQVQHVFHLGGNVDFDNGFRWLAPWPKLQQGRITVFPSIRQYQAGKWRGLPHQQVRTTATEVTTPRRLEMLLAPYEHELRKYPLYISLDKDVMVAEESVVNWDSGHLTLAEVCWALQTFMEKANGRLMGMDIVGDWSPVRLQGLFRRLLHWTEHPSLQINVDQATARNQETNLAIIKAIRTCVQGQYQPLPGKISRRASA